jgi:hypothetical protein
METVEWPRRSETTFGWTPAASASVACVVDLLRESGVEVVYDEKLVEIAEANGSSGFDALDLATAYDSGVENLRAGNPRSR